jgi:phage tail-like protein
MPVIQEQFTPAIWFELKLSPLSAPVGYYTEVTGLTAEIEVMTYNEGGRNDSVHKLPTRMKHPNLVLKRGVTTVKDLQSWLEDSFMGPTRKEVTLTMYNQQLEKIRTWSFKNAYPVKWTGPSFNASQNAVATEAIEIVHDGIKVA